MKKYLSLFFLLSNLSFSQTVIYTKGLSLIETEGFKKEIQKGDILSYGGTIITEKDSLLLISFPSGSKLKIDPDSKITLKEPIIEEGIKQNNFELLRGSLMMNFIREKSSDELIIERNNIALAVRGTTFFIGEDEQDIVASVEKGTISLIDKNTLDYESVSKGESIIIEREKNFTRPTPQKWSKDLNWTLDEKKTERSGFKVNQFRQRRRSEIKKRIGELRKRTRKQFKGLIRGRLKERIRNNHIKKNNQKSKKQRVQNFKKKMMKRKILRRNRR